jgi:hypothetical protein
VINVVLRYGPKGLAKSATIGYCAEYDCVKKTKFLHYAPLGRIRYCVIGHSPGFGFAHWAVEPNLVPIGIGSLRKVVSGLWAIAQ